MRISDWSSDVCSSDLVACIRDDLILYETEVTAENMSSMYAPSRLVRTEVATLLGFMVQAGDAPFEHPERQPADMLVEAEALLEELHRRLNSRWFIDLPAQMERGESLPPLKDRKSTRLNSSH